MHELILYIANKNYSSWSFRPWIAMDALGIPFEERLVPFDFAAGNPEIKAISPTGRIPLLQHGTLKIWESLSILEYVAELYPEVGVWPADASRRAVARSICMEMLSGFTGLRSACPMNIKRKPAPLDNLSDAVHRDVDRISSLWKEQLAVSGGPFLFGAFSAADAMYAPVVNRLEVYGLTKDSQVLDYMARMKEHPSWVKWRDAALAEPWYVAEDEV
ncbi:glutathione S-transferase family protein [Rhizobium halophytocola]|uniref:Glutathione S-transferase n=1 Tax=Rhizobium halophytocola TaxID=735519 RepID=A0ABS4E569_9HYPH|nr:glutathione S-transferase family protein [Rhizobium halophytocola]MBP1853058.1 glutathione S-transferase [Rhizobium halophytocola]